jgi:hypothetical protein
MEQKLPFAGGLGHCRRSEIAHSKADRQLQVRE